MRRVLIVAMLLVLVPAADAAARAGPPLEGNYSYDKRKPKRAKAAVVAGTTVYMEERFDPSEGQPIEGYRSYGVVTAGSGQTLYTDELPLSGAFPSAPTVFTSYWQTLGPSGPDPPSNYCSLSVDLTKPDPVHLIVLRNARGCQIAHAAELLPKLEIKPSGRKPRPKCRKPKKPKKPKCRKPKRK